MILAKDRVRAAGCVFPVSQRELLDRSVGLRHRAGIGISEETDAMAIVVSEETGDVSICFRGKMEQDLDQEQLRE
ncbi:MAG: TIGR00159 family protein, partial [Akkermansiaceae bacterium]|nr:TIGR00159 family protein [Akkermansiaceae bacterium]